MNINGGELERENQEVLQMIQHIKDKAKKDVDVLNQQIKKYEKDIQNVKKANHDLQIELHTLKMKL